jgi:ribose transport system ATP-binding protein
VTDRSGFLEVDRISKRFGGVQALDDVSLDLRRGEVHGLVGANGAGKSTLVRILAGMHAPDSGSIRVDGHTVNIRNPAYSSRLGLNFIHQELNLVPKLTALENLSIGLPKPKRGGLLVNWGEVHRSVAAVAERLNMRFDLKSPVETLSVADRWLISIGRALLREARLIAMDEPTASLSDEETHRLFDIVRELSASGVGILYVSHRLDEIIRLCARVTIFRDGRTVATLDSSDVTHRNLVHGIVGRDLVETPRLEREPTSEQPLIALRSVRRLPRVQDVSLELFAGEVLGLAGLVGAGRTEVARVIFGADKPTSGEVLMRGVTLHSLSVGSAVRHGISLIPEERRSQGLILKESLSFNANLASLSALRIRRHLPFVANGKARDRARGIVNDLQIRTPSVTSAVAKLSGGNQQKVVIGKWLLTGADVMLMDEPTRGVDVGARAEIYQLIRHLAAQGRAVLVISSEFDEFRHCCDRVLVMVSGRVTASLAGDEMSEERILQECYRGDATDGVVA